jgi:photosystem II stability/assembly factor-like uncharacterized protein
VATGGRIYIQHEENYTEIGPSEPVSIFYVMEQGNTQTLIAGSSTGILYLKDVQDKEWQQANLKLFKQPINTIAGDSRNGYIYVGQASKIGGGLWRSNDNGTSWEKLTSTTTRCVVVHPENSNILYTVDRVTNISTDQGTTWNKVKTPANYGVLIHPLSPEIAYIAFSGGVVLAEHDGKITTTQHFELPGAMTCLEMNFTRLGEWAVGIWDYPSGTGDLYFSFDSGQNWVKIEELANFRITDMRFSKAGDKLYVATAEQGLWMLNLEKVRNRYSK